ncbi:MAG: ABC transporter substrate-binding protein [Peptoniphilaceae bacterium]|nr:ABC transporter substrate-binding protein [Peptoniphilaceae bacterium]MDY3987331.1 ABC transporter substrate-binding protein [Peptoniphilaceae bacterium]
MKKIRWAALILGTLLMTACGSSLRETPLNSQTDSGQGMTSSSGTEKRIRVGVVQLVQHPALDAATKGFRETLEEEFRDRISVDVQNASGDVTNATTIVNGMVSSGVDLILANATASLQAATAATTEIPILGTSITDYGSALDIKNWTGTVGGNVSGTTDLVPLDQQAAMVKEWAPEAKKVGILYASSESNSRYQADTIKPFLEKMGYTVSFYTFTDTNDVTGVTQKAADESDVIYIPTDNTAASNTEAIANIVLPAKVPVIAGDKGIAQGCGVATLSIDYEDLGRITGQMAIRILKGEDISKMPIESATKLEKWVNVKNATALGMQIPDGYQKMDAE